MSNSVYDVVVVGAGPSGMMAAGHAAMRGKRVLLVDKNKVAGKKLSITGGGRCNILNAEPDTKKLLEHYGAAAKFLHSPFSQHSMQDSWDFFESRGLKLVVEARQRAFPASQRAEDVTAFMKRFVNEQHVEMRLGTRMTGFITKAGTLKGISTNKGDILAQSIVMATGGQARSETGSTGEGFKYLKALGHSVHAPNPDIVPLTVSEQWVKDLSGTTLSFMKITFCPEDKAKRFAKTGKILFTHFGLSGPLILNSAREVKRLLKSGPVAAEIDMFPDTDIPTVRNRVLEVFNANKNKQLKNIIKDIAPAGMSEAVLAHVAPDLHDEKVHSVPKEARQALADLLKAMPLTVTGTLGYEKAVISDGGVDLSEVNTKTMASKLYPNLFLTGDVLHINRPSGGYSLQLCWTTGFVAGTNA
ncbi:NAD(P)/FAD-dependent oxidoreductase [Candidatus Kaiserbacteria bacterium]|nr:NAD(P)/FAD-dependent oxidoreductase [Candidatus Kaiserbacteria bacterium]